jgi:Fur family transcriptional regulator, ferric uptake regulator
MNSAVDAVRSQLAARKYRITAQRLAIIEEFATVHRYVTPRQLHDRCKRKRLRVGLATVYRTLLALHDIGAAAQAPQTHGESAYLFCPIDHHHHAVCTKCGAVEDIPCRSLGPIERVLTTDFRFRLEEHRLDFLGVCARCS